MIKSREFRKFYERSLGGGMVRDRDAVETAELGQHLFPFCGNFRMTLAEMCTRFDDAKGRVEIVFRPFFFPSPESMD